MRSGPEFDFLTNHAKTLLLIAHDQRIIYHLIERLVSRHGNRSAIKLWLAQLRAKQKRSTRTLEQKITLDSITRLQTQLIIRPELMKEQIRRGATRAVSGHAGLAAVRIENANLKISVARLPAPYRRRS